MKVEAEELAKLLHAHAPKLKRLETNESASAFTTHLKHTFIKLMTAQRGLAPEENAELNRLITRCWFCPPASFDMA
jgi:hypothetical protein